jgi:hypothetical protein
MTLDLHVYSVESVNQRPLDYRGSAEGVSSVWDEVAFPIEF